MISLFNKKWRRKYQRGKDLAGERPAGKIPIAGKRPSGEKTGHPDVNMEHFEIIGFNSREVYLRIPESIFIYKDKPTHNGSISVFPLGSL